MRSGLQPWISFMKGQQVKSFQMENDFPFSEMIIFLS